MWMPSNWVRFNCSNALRIPFVPFFSRKFSSQVRVKIKIWNAAFGKIVQDFMKNVSLLKHMRQMFWFGKWLLFITGAFLLFSLSERSLRIIVSKAGVWLSSLWEKLAVRKALLGWACPSFEFTNFCIVFCPTLQPNCSPVASRRSLPRAWSRSVPHPLAPWLPLHVLLLHSGHLRPQVMGAPSQGWATFAFESVRWAWKCKPKLRITLGAHWAS